MTKEEINNRAAEIEISVAQGEAMIYLQIEMFNRHLRDLFAATDSLRYKLKSVLDEHHKNEREKLKVFSEETKALRKELSAIKNRENKPKGDRRITNATLCRILNISDSILKSRLLHLGVMHKPWGYLEVHDTWFGKVKLAGLLRKGKNVNVWVWTPEGRDKFIEIHNKHKW